VAADVDPSVNLARLREIGGGDPELEQRLVGMYLAEADEALTGIKVAIDAQSCRDLFLLAHKLAGSSATFGMSAIYPHLIHLERLGRQGDLGDAARVLSEAHRQLERMRQFLAAHHGQAISRLQQDKQGVT
jgi:HPt (histidine-containing phosphotransfer) domain-containing protein